MKTSMRNIGLQIADCKLQIEWCDWNINWVLISTFKQIEQVFIKALGFV